MGRPTGRDQRSGEPEGPQPQAKDRRRGLICRCFTPPRGGRAAAGEISPARAGFAAPRPAQVTSPDPVVAGRRMRKRRSRQHDFRRRQCRKRLIREPAGNGVSHQDPWTQRQGWQGCPEWEPRERRDGYGQCVRERIPACPTDHRRERIGQEPARQGLSRAGIGSARKRQRA